MYLSANINSMTQHMQVMVQWRQDTRCLDRDSNSRDSKGDITVKGIASTSSRQNVSGNSTRRDLCEFTDVRRMALFIVWESYN